MATDIVRAMAQRGLLWPVLLVGLALVLPSWISNAGALKWTLWLCYGILALSLTLVWGVAGIFSFGQNAFFGIGAYAYAVAALNFYPSTGETLSALLIAACAAALFAAALGYVMFYGRVGDVYLAIVTLSFTLILYTVMSSTAGPEFRIGVAQLGGFNGMPSLPGIAMGGTELNIKALFAFVACAGAALYALVGFLVSGKYGEVLAGLRENETRMELLGYDVRLLKLLIFTLSAALAGVGGALFAAWGTFVNPAVFSLPQAALVAIWVMVGGRGSLAGAFVGVGTVQWVCDKADAIIAQQTPLVLGVILLIVVMVFPGGIVPTLRRLFQRISPKLMSRTVAGAASANDHLTMPAALVSTPSVRGTLAARDVGKRFGGVTVLDALSIEWGSEPIHIIVGPNGAGKSTLFKLLTGQLAATRGSIEFNNTAITHLPSFERARRGLGIKLQVPSVFLGLTVEQNVRIARMAPRHNRSAKASVETVLAAVALLPQRQTIAANLSHGEQQWLEIALLIAQNPSMMLFDEPAAGMTQEERRKTVELLRRLSEQHTIVVVEHDMAFVRALAAPIVMLYQGGIFKRGSFDELSADADVRAIYLGRKRAA